MKNKYKLNDELEEEDLNPFCEYDGEKFYNSRVANTFQAYHRMSKDEKSIIDKDFNNHVKVSRSGRVLLVGLKKHQNDFFAQDFNGNTFRGRLKTYNSQIYIKGHPKVADYKVVLATFKYTPSECCFLEADHETRKVDFASDFTLFNEISNLDWKTTSAHRDKTAKENSNPQAKGTKNPQRYKEAKLQLDAMFSLCFEKNAMTNSYSEKEKISIWKEKCEKVLDLANF